MTIDHGNGLIEHQVRDAIYPLPLHGRLTVHAGQRVTISLTARAQSIGGQIVDRPERPRAHRLTAVRLDNTGRRWRLRLPRHIARGADRLNFEVLYAPGNADTNFEAGIRLLRGR